MSDPEQLPPFPTPEPTPAPSSPRWVRDAIKESDTRRDGDKYDADKFIESTNKETP